MKYFLFDRGTGKIRHFTEVPFLDVSSDAFGLGVIEAEGFSEWDIPRLAVVDGALIPVTPPVVYATLEQIKSEWLRREQAPVLVGTYYLDCDPVSELRIKNTIEAWWLLPLIPGQLEEDNGIRSVIWTLADNTKQRLLLQDLEIILPALVNARAVRAAILYAAYQRLKVRTDVTLAELNDDTSWV